MVHQTRAGRRDVRARLSNVLRNAATTQMKSALVAALSATQNALIREPNAPSGLEHASVRAFCELAVIAKEVVPGDSADGWFSADITFVPTASGFLYLAVVLDAWSRKTVGWSMANHLRAAVGD